MKYPGKFIHRYKLFTFFETNIYYYILCIIYLYLIYYII